MPKITFEPSHTDVDVDPNTKILLAARKGRVPLRYGCASCRCGTCAVEVSNKDAFSPMRPDEETLLKRIGLPLDGNVRLSCQARITSDVTINISFQDTYSPDDVEGDGGSEDDSDNE